MSEEFVTTDREQMESEPVEAPPSRPGYLIPVLILAVLAAVTIGGYFVYQRATGASGLARPARPPRIAFMSDRDGNWEVYIMDRDGSNLVNLTNAPSADGLPIPVPGRDQLAFVSDRDGDLLDLFLMDLNGENVTNITHTPDSNDIPIDWSPDGQYLVFVNDQSGSSEVFLRQTDSGEVINLSERDDARAYSDWSSQTNRLILATDTEAGITLFTTDPNGSEHQPLTDGTYPAGGARWSPDGRQVAFMAIAPDSTSIDIFLVDAAGGEPINLTQSPSNDRFPRWSPDGSKIAFLSDRDGNHEIYVMNPDGSNPVNLTNSPAEESVQGDFAWSPDGRQILFHSDRDGNVEIYVMDADGSNQVNLTNSPGTDFSAVWVE